MNNPAPRPMPFAIMRNSHEAMRTSIRVQQQALEANEPVAFREAWADYVRARAVHMAMEDGNMFALLDGVSDGAVSASGLPEEHAELKRTTCALEAELAAGDPADLQLQWEAWRDLQLEHLQHEEQVLNPLVGKTASSPAEAARVVHERLLKPVENLPDFEWYIGWVVHMLSAHGSTGQPPNVATRVFAWGLQHACSPAQWDRLRPVVQQNCTAEIWAEMTAEFGLDGEGKIR